MSSERSKNRWAGIFIGPALVVFSLMAIWKNETRFDFHRAAAKTQPMSSLAGASPGQVVSYTGPMDQNLTMSGEYVESFSGYLYVQRTAQIYAWDRDKDSDGHVKWNLRWMNHVESNNRNQGVRQELSSRRFQPSSYQVGDLSVTVQELQFVDASQYIPSEQLEIRREGLVGKDSYLYLYKNESQGLGDERVHYQAIPVPATATYFGKLESGQGVPDTTHQRTGFINGIIQDTGILHHLVAGDRPIALATMKAYLGRLKWIVRGIASSTVVLGLLILFSTIVGWLYHIPVIGRVVEAGAFIAALAIGIPLVIITMSAAYLIAHPIILLGIVLLGAATVAWIRWRGTRSQAALQDELAIQFGHDLTADETKELEFMELAQLAMSDGDWKPEEQAFLKQWARKHRWREDKVERLLSEARLRQQDVGNETTNDQHLLNLIRLALADGNVSPYELRSIRKTARRLGYDDSKIAEMMRGVRNGVHQPISQPSFSAGVS